MIMMIMKKMKDVILVHGIGDKGNYLFSFFFSIKTNNFFLSLFLFCSKSIDQTTKDCFNLSVKSKSFSSPDTPNNVYLSMAPIDINKHQPPKKPPRRNYSLSPTYLNQQQQLLLLKDGGGHNYHHHNHHGGSSDGYDDATGLTTTNNHNQAKQNYEYLFLSKTGYNHDNDNHNNDEDDGGDGDGGEKRINNDDYIDMKQQQQHHQQQHNNKNNYYENFNNIGMRIINPNRKLKRNYNKTSIYYDNLNKEQKSYLIINNKENKNNNHHHPSADQQQPMSPTNYKQPPTPEHPPPTPTQAELFIHEIILPISQEYKRRSKCSNTSNNSYDYNNQQQLQTSSGGCGDNNLIYQSSLGASSASLSSSISLSDDRSISTDCVEEYIGDQPFAGLMKGGTNNFLIERPKTLIVNQQQNQITISTNSLPTNINVLSPFDEQEEWSKISEIVASFGENLFKDNKLLFSDDGGDCDDKGDKDGDDDDDLYKLKQQDQTITINSNYKIHKWLKKYNLSYLERSLIDNGYDDIEFIVSICLI